MFNAQFQLCKGICNISSLMQSNCQFCVFVSQTPTYPQAFSLQLICITNTTFKNKINNISTSVFPANSLASFTRLVPRSTYSGRQLLVGYWGQNGAGPSSGPANYEKPLIDVCRTTKYDIIAVSFLIIFFDQRQGGIDILYFAFKKSKDALRDISNTRNSVSSDFQTPRSELKIRRAAEY